MCPAASEQRFLLPGLRTLHCSVPVEWLENLVYLAPPSLCSLFISHPDSHCPPLYVVAPVELKVLSRMKLPRLHTLSVENFEVENTMMNVSSFQSLTVLSVQGLTSTIGSRFLEELSCLSHLETIKLAFPKFSSADEAPNNQFLPVSWKCGSVTTLKSVDITGMPSTIAVFMEGLQGCALTHLLITIGYDRDDPSLSLHVIGRLGQSLSMAGTKSLATLVIDDVLSVLPRLRLLGATNKVKNGRSKLIFSNAFIYCFLQFQNLKTLRYVGEFFQLNKSEADAIIKSTSWRKTLQELKLPRGEYDESLEQEYNTSPPTLRQLRKLTSALTNLKILDIYIHLDDQLPSPSSSGRTSQLEVLEIGTDRYLEQDSILAIAEYLDQMAPNLIDVRTYEIEQSSIWDDIWEAIMLCQRVRKRALGVMVDD